MGYDPYAHNDHHVPNGHNGDCIYCCGFSYDDPWWEETCKKRVEFDRQSILGRPDRIRKKIVALQEELKEALRAAESVGPPSKVV